MKQTRKGRKVLEKKETKISELIKDIEPIRKLINNEIGISFKK